MWSAGIAELVIKWNKYYDVYTCMSRCLLNYKILQSQTGYFFGPTLCVLYCFSPQGRNSINLMFNVYQWDHGDIFSLISLTRSIIFFRDVTSCNNYFVTLTLFNIIFRILSIIHQFIFWSECDCLLHIASAEAAYLYNILTLRGEGQDHKIYVYVYGHIALL